MIGSLARRTSAQVAKQCADLFGRSPGPDEWALGITATSSARLLTEGISSAVRWLHPPNGRFYADPCCITREHTSYIFFEEFLRNERHGRICVVVTRDFDTFSPPQVVLERSFHLSCPCVFVYRDRYYLVPEQHQSNAVVLYEAERFPDRWRERATLLAGFPGVDPTLFEYAGRWWMFVTNRADDDVSRLYLFSAAEPFGPWAAHPANPVRCLKHRARPAGVPFVVGDALVIPSQDCRQTYGGRIELHRLRALSPTAYREEFIGAIEPQPQWPYPLGLHTISIAGPAVVFDAKRKPMTRNDFRLVLRRKVRAIAAR